MNKISFVLAILLVSVNAVPNRHLIPVRDISPVQAVETKLAHIDEDWKNAIVKARDFVSKLTLLEKVNLTTGVGNTGRCAGQLGSIPRLGLRPICFHDSPVGVRDTDGNSVFPAGINAAATFDKQLIYKRGYALGQEFRGKGINVALGPTMNMARLPAAGRNFEGFGGDPYLTGIAAAETIRGIQDNGVIACAKHFVGNEQEHFRGNEDALAESSDIDDRTMHEIYSWPFAASIRAGVGSVMCSYNRLNGTYACENSKGLNGILKEELNFQGFVVSDWTAIKSGAPSVNAGTDINMPQFFNFSLRPGHPIPYQAYDSWWGGNFVSDVMNGSVSVDRLDDMITRTMAAYYKLGQDENYPEVNFDRSTLNTSVNGEIVNMHINVQGDHKNLIREIGAASIFLLKNQAVLPLNFKQIKQLAIIGSDAGPSPEGINACKYHGCNNGTLGMGWGSGTANFPYLIDPKQAIEDYIKINSPTTRLMSTLNDSHFSAVEKVARDSDVCMVFINSDSGEIIAVVKDDDDIVAGDRNHLRFWHHGDELVLKTASVCKNTVVVTHAVGATLVEQWIEHPNVTAVIWAGILGEESGNALVDVITGVTNPSGRLPYTIAKSESDYPAQLLYNVTSWSEIPHIIYSEKLEIDYRYFDAKSITPRFEFGFGLSYTQFNYSNLKVENVGAKVGRIALSNGFDTDDKGIGGSKKLYEDAIYATVNITNVGSFDGHEVAQLYLSFPSNSGEPPKILRGFERTLIQKGKTVTVTFSLCKKDLAIWDVIEQNWVIPSGEFEILIGSSSRIINQRSPLNLAASNE